MSAPPPAQNKGPANSAANRQAIADKQQQQSQQKTNNQSRTNIPGVPPGGKVVGGHVYDANGNPVRVAQLNNTAENRTALEDAGISYTQRGSSLFADKAAIESASLSIPEGYSSFTGTETVGGEPRYVSGQIKQNKPSVNYEVSLGESLGVSDIGFSAKTTKAPPLGFSKPPPSEQFENSGFEVKSKEPPAGTKNIAFDIATKGNYGYSWVSGKTGKTFDRKSSLESQVKQNEADRAASIFVSTSNADYVTGGTPPPRSQGGVETPQSKKLESETNYGWGVGQNIRNSNAEKLLMVSEEKKGLAKESKENVPFTSFNEPSKPSPSAKPSRPQVKATPFSALSPTGDVFPERDLSFNDFVNTQASKGATFDILVNNKVVGEVKGPNSLASIIAYEKAHPDQQIAVSAYYPDRETEFLSALKSNPSNYSNLPQSYWDKISSQGFIGQTNIKQVNNILQIQYEADTRASLGKYQGDVSQSLYIENENGAVSSFMRAPFSGTKIPTPWGNYTIPGGNKAQTSTIPSTSILTPLSDFWFKPYEFLGFAVIKIADRVDPFLGKLGFQIKNKVNTGIQKRVLYNDLTKLNNAPKNLKELKITLEPQVRQRPTFRSTNPTRTSLPSDIIKPDNALSKATGSASQFIKPNHLENVGPERTSNFNKIMNDLLTPNPESTNPAASTNIFNNFFKGQVTAKGKPYAGFKSPLDLVSNLSSNEGANVQPKASGLSPIIRITEPDTQLSPTSREFFGQQFNGVFPTSYLPPSSIFNPDIIKPDIYSNAGEGVFDASTFRNNAETNYKEFEIKLKAAKAAKADKTFGFLIKEKPLVPIRVKNAIGQYYKATSPIDFFAENSFGRASRIESTFIREDSEVFSNKGIKYRNQYGDIFFAERGAPKGALRTITQDDLKPVQGPVNEGYPQGLISPREFKGRAGYSARSPLETLFPTITGYSENIKNVKEFLGLEGEKLGKSSGKLGGKPPLEDFGFIAQSGFREGDIVGINKETGTFERVFSSESIVGFGPKVKGAPSDIQTGLKLFTNIQGKTRPYGGDLIRGNFVTGKGVFSNAPGSKYYLAGEVKSTGGKILRGELSAEHDIVNLRFSKWLAKNPPQESIGPKGVWSDLEKSLPKNYGKAATFSTTFRETNKGFKGKSNSGSEFFKTKPEEKAPKGFEFFNKGSKSETVLIKKPLIRKSLTETKEQTDYLYGYNTTPPAKEGSILSGRIDDLLSSSNKLAPRILVGTKANTELAKILKSMNNQKEINVNVFSTKQTPRQKPNQSLTPKQLPRILQTPKQSQTPKQGTKQTPKMPTPLRPRTNTTQAPVPRPAFPTITTQILNPPRKPPLDNLGGFKIRGKNYKSKSGPTALFDLGISNPFFSSLNTKRGKVEF